MGWFWADTPQPRIPAAPNSLPPSDNSPPLGCPMHGSNVASLPSSSRHETTASTMQSFCPTRSPNSPFYSVPSPSSLSSGLASESLRSSPQQSSMLSKLNPLNYMFSHLSQERAPGQTIDLPVEREVSSIPRGDASTGNWEYPSPQQMYNAMLRKGYTDTPQDAVESMVAVHNFLNEGAWVEIMEWEQIFSKGLKSGWDKCRRGSEHLALELAKERLDRTDEESPPRLVRFQGRPQELTPKARMLQALGWLYPAKFGTDPPFDRHDWFVSRHTPSGQKEIRYVIDYYSGCPEPTGEPVFYLDIRPAIDTPTAAVERLMRWWGDVWWKASGGAARE